MHPAWPPGAQWMQCYTNFSISNDLGDMNTCKSNSNSNQTHLPFKLKFKLKLEFHSNSNSNSNSTLTSHSTEVILHIYVFWFITHTSTYWFASVNGNSNCQAPCHSALESMSLSGSIVCMWKQRHTVPYHATNRHDHMWLCAIVMASFIESCDKYCNAAAAHFTSFSVVGPLWALEPRKKLPPLWPKNLFPFLRNHTLRISCQSLLTD